MKATRNTMTAVTFLVVSLFALPGAFAADPVADAQAENAALRTIIKAQNAASPTYPNVPLLKDAKKANVELLKDNYADVKILDDEQSKSAADSSDLLAIR